MFVRKRILREILKDLEEILARLDGPADGSVFRFGKPIPQEGSVANTQLAANQKMSYIITETKGGAPIAPGKGDSVVITASTADVSIVPDASPVAGALASGFVVGNPASAGAIGVAITETITLAGGTVLPAVTNLVDVTPAVAQVADGSTFVFGTPVSQ